MDYEHMGRGKDEFGFGHVPVLVQWDIQLERPKHAWKCRLGAQEINKLGSYQHIYGDQSHRR